MCIRDSFDMIWDAIYGAVSKVVEGAIEVGGNLIDWFKDLPGKLIDGLGDIVDKFLTMGKDSYLRGGLEGRRGSHRGWREPDRLVQGPPRQAHRRPGRYRRQVPDDGQGH